MPGTVDTTIALVSLADQKEYLGIASGTTSEDSILSFFINEISARCNSYTGRFILSKSYTEYYDGDGSEELFLKNYPVTVVSSIYDDVNREFNSNSLISSDNYIVETTSGIIRLWNRMAFNCGKANIKIVYTAGYAIANVPGDLKGAVKRWVALLYQKYVHKRWDQQSESIGDNTMTFIEEAIPKEVAAALDNHVKLMAAPNFSY